MQINDAQDKCGYYASTSVAPLHISKTPAQIIDFLLTDTEATVHSTDALLSISQSVI